MSVTLEVSYYSESNANMFPSSLFTCESLVVLKLRCMILKDVPSTGCRLPSEPSVYVSRVLEDLEVRFIEDEYPQMFTAAFPLLRAEVNTLFT